MAKARKPSQHQLGLELEAPPKPEPEVEAPAAAAVALPPEPVAEVAHAALALAEVAGFNARWLGGLPMATTLRVRLGAVRWHVTTGRQLLEALRGGGAVVLTSGELAALVTAAQYGRASAAWFAGWLAHRAIDADHMLTVAAAFGIAGQAGEPDWPDAECTIGRVLAAWGCELDAVAVGDGADTAWLAERAEVPL